MKPKAFDYVRVDTLPALFAALQAHDNAKIIAGGQSLLGVLVLMVRARAARVRDPLAVESESGPDAREQAECGAGEQHRHE